MASTTGKSSVLEQERIFWERHESFEWLTEESVRAVLTAVPPVSGDVLELCAGSGMFTRQLPRSATSVTCLDLSETLLERLKRTVPAVCTVQGDASNSDLPDASFDYVCVFAGLHHLPDVEAAIHNAYRLLRPEGVFVCFEPNDRCWYRQPMKVIKPVIGFYSDDEVFLDPDRITRVLREAGFNAIRETYTTPRYSDQLLWRVWNRWLARLVYLGGSISQSRCWQTFFTISGTRP